MIANWCLPPGDFFYFFSPSPSSPPPSLKNKLEREAERGRGSKEKNGKKKVVEEEKTGGRSQVRLRSVAGAQQPGKSRTHARTHADKQFLHRDLRPTRKVNTARLIAFLLSHQREIRKSSLQTGLAEVERLAVIRR